MNGLLQDLRYGLRGLWRNRAFTIVTLVSLALGVGANTAIFSLVNAVLLRPLDFPNPDRLVMIWEDASALGNPPSESAPGNYSYWKAQQSVFEDMAALRWQTLNIHLLWWRPSEVKFTRLIPTSRWPMSPQWMSN